MDCTPEDDVLVISKFLSRLQSDVGDGTETAKSVEAELQKLASKLNVEYESLDAEWKSHDVKELMGKLPPSVLEAEKLRNENRALLISLQRQDFLKAWYEKLLGEHQDLLDSIKNSVINRKNYVDVKQINDELQFEEKCSRIEADILLLKRENQNYDQIFLHKTSEISKRLATVKVGLDESDSREQEMFQRLEQLEQLLQTK